MLRRQGGPDLASAATDQCHSKDTDHLLPYEGNRLVLRLPDRRLLLMLRAGGPASVCVSKATLIPELSGFSALHGGTSGPS